MLRAVLFLPDVLKDTTMHPNSIVGVSTSLILRYYSFIFKLELLGFFVVCLESSDDISTSPQCLFNYT